MVSLDLERLELAQNARRSLERTVSTPDILAHLGTPGAVHEPFWTMARAQGWSAALVPEAYEGLGLSLGAFGGIAFEIGRRVAGAPFLTTSYAVIRALIGHGRESDRQRWLPALASGALIGSAALGAGHGLAHGSLRFSGGRLDGIAPGVAGGAQADIAVVLADGEDGPVLAIAELGPVRRRRFDSIDTLRGTADLIFPEVAAGVLARGREATEAALDVLAAQAVLCAFEQAGGAADLVERARDHACARKAFGQPIGAFQGIKHKIATMYGLSELARAASEHAALREGAPDFRQAAAAARLQAIEAYDTCARECVQVHGGTGVTWESGLHLHLRRARTLAIELGPAIVWEDILINTLLAEGR